MLTPRRPRRAATAALTATLAAVTSAASAVAALALPATSAAAAPSDPARPPVVVTPGPAGGTVGIDVYDRGSRGQRGDGSEGSAAGNASGQGSGPAVDPCALNPTGTACAAYDHDRYCRTWGQTFTAAGLPPTGLGPLLESVGCTLEEAAATPAVLAQEAYGLLRLPARRSNGPRTPPTATTASPTRG